MPDVPDLAALVRGIDRLADRPVIGKTLPEIKQTVKLSALERDWIVREARAVMALVDDQQKEIGRLREALEEYGDHQHRCSTQTLWGRGPCDCGWPETVAALAGSPAANEEQQYDESCPRCEGDGFDRVTWEKCECGETA